MQELVQVPKLVEKEMFHQPLEANFFPGILEGLIGRLGLAPPSVINPPISIQEGMARHWVAALREAI